MKITALLHVLRPQLSRMAVADLQAGNVLSLIRTLKPEIAIEVSQISALIERWKQDTSVKNLADVLDRGELAPAVEALIASDGKGDDTKAEPTETYFFCPKCKEVTSSVELETVP